MGVCVSGWVGGWVGGWAGDSDVRGLCLCGHKESAYRKRGYAHALRGAGVVQGFHRLSRQPAAGWLFGPLVPTEALHCSRVNAGRCWMLAARRSTT